MRPSRAQAIDEDRVHGVLASFRSVLDAIDVAACIVGASGEILCANEIAMRYRSLKGTISRIPRDLGWDVVPLRIGAGCVGFLAICRWQTDESRIGDAVRSAVLRWRLTPRQGRVLALVAQGLTNAAIAEHLGIGEGTIEFHISALFDKAGVENRATLIVKILEM
jgi:DNA-binding NarL/FixJ family response regulator